MWWAGSWLAETAVTYQVEGNSFILTTERYRISFQAGALVSLENLIVGEKYTTDTNRLADRFPHLVHGLGTMAGLSEKDKEELEKMHQWAGETPYQANWKSFHHPTLNSKMEVKKISATKFQVTWKGLQAFNPERFYPLESYTLDLEVLPGEGDLSLLATAQADRPGVFASGFLMANFRNNLRFILPETNGFWFIPDGKPVARCTHWPYPWHASLVIGEGEKGSFGLWMADPFFRDRYLHRRSNPDCYDFVFESVNDAPFETWTEAVSRPIRINVYSGNWIKPASSFQNWWATTFNVKPISERQPSWLKEAALVSPHYAPPPKEMIPRTIFWAPQHWKVGPKIGDTGLFPYEIEKGPELNALQSSLPYLKENNGQVMVYLNINHMNEGHPWAGRFWEHRIIKPFGKREIERQPQFQAPGSFLVNSAYRPWQDLILWWAEESYKRFGIQGFYMDCAAGIPNSLTGLIDGKNDAFGQRELMRRMKEKIPGCWLGVEYVTEVTATVADTGFVGYDSWWPGSLPEREKNIHPILGFLFNRYVHLWFCHNPNPVFDEVLGRLPLVEMKVIDDRYVTDYAITENFGSFFARWRWKNSPIPVYPENWEKNVRAYYTDATGNLYRVVAETPRESRMIKLDRAGKESLVYWRIKDREKAQLSPGTGIEGWVAYQGDSAIGLLPEKSYLYLGKPRYPDWEVTHLPEKTAIAVSRPYTDGLLVLELVSLDGKKHEGIVELVTTHRIALALNKDGKTEIEKEVLPDEKYLFRGKAKVPGVIVFSTKQPRKLIVREGENVLVALYQLGLEHQAYWESSGLRVPMEKRLWGKANQAGVIQFFPRWQQSGCLEWLLELPEVPEGKKLLLKFGTLITPHEGNNVILNVCLNGEAVLRQKITGTKTNQPTWHQVDLTGYAGKAILLSLQALDCYLFNWLFLHQASIVLE